MVGLIEVDIEPPVMEEPDIVSVGRVVPPPVIVAGRVPLPACRASSKRQRPRAGSDQRSTVQAAAQQGGSRSLGSHFSTIRDVENTMQGMAVSCSDELLDMSAIEAMNSGQAFSQNGQIEEVAKLQMELVALTFACNANRVATLQVGDGTDQTRYTINGQTVERFHWVSHRVQSDGSSGAAIPQALEWHIAIDRLRMGTLKHLLEKWEEYQTPSGPLLDNAFAMWTSHVATGPPHGFNNLPIIIAGSAGGFLKQGQYVDAGGVSNARVFNTLLTAMGLPTDDFGEGGSGTLSAMIA
jgi:hypothetical protein